MKWKKVCSLYFVLCSFIIILMLYPALPVSSDRMQRSIAIVECRSHYELCIDGQTAFYMDDCKDIANARISFSKDSIPYIYKYAGGQWMYRHAFLPICNGTMAVSDTANEGLTDIGCKEHVEKYIAELVENSKETDKKLDELDYYLRTHNVLDDGYNEIAYHTRSIRKAKAKADSAASILAGIKPGQKTKVKAVKEYAIIYNKVRIECGLLASNGLVSIIQAKDKKTPEGAAPLFLKNLFFSYRKPKGAVSDYFDNNGLLNGHAILTDSNSLYSGYVEHGKKSGHGVMELGKERRRIVGKWNADTIESGKITDGENIYAGSLNSSMHASGFGTSRHSGGAFYKGEWTDGKRHGFGWAVDSAGNIKSGEWKNDRFCGERLLYTPERIYGIDISRHQHEKGRKRYSINWKAVRITHLGKISEKRVNGTVDYPVSFVYIKSTEGTTVRNRYYASDYTLARKDGMKCGAYHFFSLKSDAKRQANYFLKNSRFSSGDFPPVLDVEPSDAQIRKAGGAEAMFRMVRTWLRTVESRTGMRPILYVSQTFVNKYLPLAPDIMNNYKVWIARYGEYKPDVKLIFWQLCPDGRVSGIHGDVDINVFNGYKDVYEHFLENERFR